MTRRETLDALLRLYPGSGWGEVCQAVMSPESWRRVRADLRLRGSDYAAAETDDGSVRVLTPERIDTGVVMTVSRLTAADVLINILATPGAELSRRWELTFTPVQEERYL